jgi:hypothetical protein
MNRTTPVTDISRLSFCTLLSVLSGALLLGGPARAQTCAAYPIALSAQSLSTVAFGDVVTNIWNRSQPGNFGWLSWTGDPGEPTLVGSLTQPGDSYTYVNPDNPGDHQLVVGNWVSGRPGVANGEHLRAALNALIGVQIIVPVWDQARGQGDNAACHICGFACVVILSHKLPSQNEITAQFLGYADCGGGPTT